MGKVKFRKLKKLRHNPVNLPSTEEVERARVPENSRSEKQLPVISQLTSGKAEERIWACYSIANLVFDKPSLQCLIANGVISKIAPLLIDKDHTVKEAAAGALRNLVTVGADELTDHVINNDIIASLLACIKECCAVLEQITGETGKGKQVASRKDEWNRILEHSLHSLSSMSESNQVVVDAANDQDVVPLLFVLLKSHTSSSQIVKSIVQCLLTLTEDNDTVIKWLCDHQENLSLLESLLSSDCYTIGTATLVRAVVVGIFHNVYDGIGEDMKYQVLTAIIKELANILRVDIEVILANKNPATVEMVEEVKDILTAHQLSLEIITNLCYEEDGNEESWEDMEEEVEIGADGEEQNGTMSIEDDGSSIHLQKVAKLFGEQQIPARVLQRCPNPEYNLGDFTDKVKAEILDRACVIQCRALTALNALTSIVSVADLEGKGNLVVVWNSLYVMASDNKPVKNSDEFFEALTSAQLGILEKLSSIEQSTECLSHDQIKWMCENVMSSVSRDPSIQVNMVKLVGVASRLTAADEQQSKHEAKVKLSLFANALKKCVESSKSLWTVCKAVDVMYDVFGSSVPLAELLSANGVISTLQHLTTNFKERFKIEESVLRQHPAHVMGVVEMVGDNLTNFIDYLKHPT